MLNKVKLLIHYMTCISFYIKKVVFLSLLEIDYGLY